MAEEGKRGGPLSGVRVVDLTTVVMGPSSTQILGDLGADIIKVEQPEGDSTRGIGPARNHGMGPLFLQNNRNKRSVMLNLKTEEGMEALHELLRTADVFVTNIRPQAIERLGLDYAGVSAVNPGIIYAAAVAYGRGGPEAGRPVYDDIMQASAGISDLFAKVDGKPRQAPVNICDRITGLYLTISITSALFHRALTGEGQEIEVPMLETMAQFVLGDHMAGSVFVPPLGPLGYMRLLSRHRGPYPTKDGHICIVVYTDAQWRAFTDLIGDPGLIDRDERFANQTVRTANAELCGEYIARYTPSRTTEEWLAFCRSIDIPAASVTKLEDLFEHPHLKAVNMFDTMEHPTEGTIRTVRFPVNFSRTPAAITRPAPRLGEHTDEVLSELRARSAAE
ncbi:CoA transferase [Nitratireductor aestuarii]|uniref:CoA transferase n=1 Tax=Nitratireductor aestuarii TaxID=1735103 RepID=A0A916RYN3_9HYPH|nr:CoA transferase [Nitratireductor aestuarii]GGA76832.1 CoA transferase [Nitratireductor aestuarii]